MPAPHSLAQQAPRATPGRSMGTGSGISSSLSSIVCAFQALRLRSTSAVKPACRRGIAQLRPLIAGAASSGGWSRCYVWDAHTRAPISHAARVGGGAKSCRGFAAATRPLSRRKRGPSREAHSLNRTNIKRSRETPSRSAQPESRAREERSGIAARARLSVARASTHTRSQPAREGTKKRTLWATPIAFAQKQP